MSDLSCTLAPLERGLGGAAPVLAALARILRWHTTQAAHTEPGEKTETRPSHCRDSVCVCVCVCVYVCVCVVWLTWHRTIHRLFCHHHPYRPVDTHTHTHTYTCMFGPYLAPQARTMHAVSAIAHLRKTVRNVCMRVYVCMCMRVCECECECV